MLHNTFPPRSNSAPKPLTATLMQEVITTHQKFLKSVPASRAWGSAHILEKQICLKIQQRQSNAKWFQSLLLLPSVFFNSKKFEGFFNISRRLGEVQPLKISLPHTCIPPKQYYRSSHPPEKRGWEKCGSLQFGCCSLGVFYV